MLFLFFFVFFLYLRYCILPLRLMQKYDCMVILVSFGLIWDFSSPLKMTFLLILAWFCTLSLFFMLGCSRTVIPVVLRLICFEMSQPLYKKNEYSMTFSDVWIYWDFALYHFDSCLNYNRTMICRCEFQTCFAWLCMEQPRLIL